MKIQRSSWSYQVEVEILRPGDDATVGGVCAALNEQLRGLFDETPFTLDDWDWRDPDPGKRRWSELRAGYSWLAVYTVDGTEGHWVHVDLIRPGRPYDAAAKREALGLFACTTLRGLAHALDMAALARYCLDDA